MLVTADLDALTVIHTHTLRIHPKNVPQRSSALARVMVFPQYFSTLHLPVLPIFVDVQKCDAIKVKAPGVSRLNVLVLGDRSS
jgi:hypothetical protein